MTSLRDKIYDGERINADEALELFSWDLAELGRAADARRKLIHHEEKVGFIIDRIVNFTNICEAKCSFCAYHAKAGRIDPYELSAENILQKVDELVKAGGTQVMLQGGMHPDHNIETFVHMVRLVKDNYPDIYLHSFSPSELVHIARKSGITLDEAVQQLKDAGVQSTPGASDLLVERIRSQVSPNKSTKDEWQEAIRALARHGLKSSATMTYGMGETLAERIEHLDVIRQTQDETGIIMAFIPWSFSPANTKLEHIVPATGVDYLRMVAIGRIYLDNIKFIQAGWLTEGMKLAQIALAMGANDMGGVLTEEVVVGATGVTQRTSIDENISLIRDAGKVPYLRDSQYNEIKVYEV